MPDEQFVAAPSKGSRSAMLLQIERPGEESPWQFPAVIRNLVAGVATLEVNNPWTILNWDTLKGQGGCLRLLTETGEITDLRGTINWARYSVQGQDSGILSLSLALTAPNPAAQRLLADFIPHTAKDIKGFWDRYDQAQGSLIPKTPPVPTKIGLAALALLLAGLALQLTGVTAFKLLGWLLWCGGTVVVALPVLRFWKSRRASH
ncbi:MAG: hypothetical protein NTW80_09440 [Deltaproteobacteria bacterium]|nr:hypothetical protein [Deltaproteobacteria bacterium]